MPSDGWQPPNGSATRYYLRATQQRVQRVQEPVAKPKRKTPLSTTAVLRKLGYSSTSKMVLGVGMFSKVYKATKDGEFVSDVASIHHNQR